MRDLLSASCISLRRNSPPRIEVFLNGPSIIGAPPSTWAACEAGWQTGPMRLVGYEFAGAHGPVGNGFLPLGDLTILFGANDVGKSRLLGTIAEGAASLEALMRGDPFLGDHRFFLKLHAEDAKQLLQRTYRLYVEELRAQGVEEDADAEDLEGGPPWLRFLPRDARDLDPRTSTFALELLAEWCGQPPGGAPGLLVTWCRHAEPRSANQNFATGMPGVRMGTVDLPVLPLPVALPANDPSWLRRELADAITDWLAHVQWALRSVARLESLSREPFDEVEPSAAWFELADDFIRAVDRRPPPASLWTIEDSAEGSVAYRPIARTACNHVSAIASRLAPAFVREQYEICVTPVPILSWQDEEQLQIAVKETRSERKYDVDEVADGLKLWIQIAVLEAADSLRRVELNLRNTLLTIEVAADADCRSDAIRAYLAQVKATVEEPVDPSFARTLGATFARAVRMESPWLDDEPETTAEVARRVASARPRLYLLDEPERHLNPRLQRAAAKWLVDLLLTRGSQGLIATHAHAFLNVGPEPSFVQVRRDPAGASNLQPFEPQEVTAYSEIAQEVGLDMGELLTSTRLLVFVEGRHDQAVLEELFRLPLYHAGVLVVPIAGVGRHSQIVEYDVLIRFTRAQLAVVFDKLDRQTIDRLLTDTAFRRESLRSRRTELQAMASLLQKAIDNDRRVQPLPLPVADIFDALDQQILIDQYPRFPGHAEANTAWESLQERFPNRKIFYQDEYGVPNEIETYKKVAALMRSLDRIPDTLRNLGADLERMAADEN